MQQFDMHLYHCSDCDVTFGVDVAFDDHAMVVCPICECDGFLQDAGSGSFTLTRLPETE